MTHVALMVGLRVSHMCGSHNAQRMPCNSGVWGSKPTWARCALLATTCYYNGGGNLTVFSRKESVQSRTESSMRPLKRTVSHIETPFMTIWKFKVKLHYCWKKMIYNSFLSTYGWRKLFFVNVAGPTYSLLDKQIALAWSPGVAATEIIQTVVGQKWLLNVSWQRYHRNRSCFLNRGLVLFSSTSSEISFLQTRCRKWQTLPSNRPLCAFGLLHR